MSKSQSKNVEENEKYSPKEELDKFNRTSKTLEFNDISSIDKMKAKMKEVGVFKFMAEEMVQHQDDYKEFLTISNDLLKESIAEMRSETDEESNNSINSLLQNLKLIPEILAKIENLENKIEQNIKPKWNPEFGDERIPEGFWDDAFDDIDEDE